MQVCFPGRTIAKLLMILSVLDEEWGVANLAAGSALEPEMTRPFYFPVPILCWQPVEMFSSIFYSSKLVLEC